MLTTIEPVISIRVVFYNHSMQTVNESRSLRNQKRVHKCHCILFSIKIYYDTVVASHHGLHKSRYGMTDKYDQGGNP